MEARVSVDPIFDAFGVPATVTRPNEAPIETTGVWVPDESRGHQWGVPDQSGVEIQRVVPRRLICFRTDEVPAAPYGTLVVAPEEEGGEEKRWRVDEIDSVASDLIRLIVAPMAESEYLESWGKT